MFYAKQFKDILDKVKELDPDAKVVPRLLRIDFNLPIVGKCRLEYVHRGFDDEYDALGTMKLYYGDNMTEFDSFRYTVDGLDGLDRAIKRNMAQSPVNESVEEIEDFDTMGADDLSGDVVAYLYDNYKDAAFIGEKSLPDGSIVLRFDWNGVDKNAVAKDLKDRYGDRIGFGSGHLQYAPEIKFDAIKVLPAKDAVAVKDEQLNAAAEKISAPDYHVEGAYEDLTDLGNDFESVEFYKDIKAVCGIAGRPALAEAVIKLHKAYHPVLEAEGVAEQIFANYLEKKGITEIDAVQLERILNDMVYEKRITSSDADKIWTTVMNKAQPNM